MNRSKIALGVALIAVGVVALSYWNRGPKRRPEVSVPLAVAAAHADSADGATVALAEATTFAWTDLYIVPPFSTKGAVRQMGVSWPWRWNQIGYRDGFSLLVFVDSNRIAGIVEHRRGQGDFSTQDTVQHFEKESAVFKATRRADKWVVFNPVSKASK